MPSPLSGLHDRQRPALALVLGLRAHQDLAADGAERLGLVAERLVQHHQLGRRLARFLVGVGVLELLRQRLQHVLGVGQAQRDGGLAETQVVLALVAPDAVEVVRRQVARVLDQLADRLGLRRRRQSL